MKLKGFGYAVVVPDDDTATALGGTEHQPRAGMRRGRRASDPGAVSDICCSECYKYMYVYIYI